MTVVLWTFAAIISAACAGGTIDDSIAQKRHGHPLPHVAIPVTLFWLAVMLACMVAMVDEIFV